MNKIFAGKRITMMGLGVLGRGVNLAKYLAEEGAEIIITDLKKAEDLRTSLKILEKFKNIKYVLGEHRLEDFENRDIIIKTASVPLDSLHIAHARGQGIPIKMDASLFAELAPRGVTIIGITGTRGKTTTTHLIYELLFLAKKKVYLGGNIRGLATLPLLKKVKPGDYVVLELDSWQLQGFGDAKISPDISVFTNFMRDHQNYYKGDMGQYFKDKSHIYRYHKLEHALIVSKALRKERQIESVGKVVEYRAEDVPKIWKIKMRGEHNRENISAMLHAARLLGISDSIAKQVAEKFHGVDGRLQFLGKKKGIEFWNDTTATTPDATIAAFQALKENKGKIIWLGGGADKALQYAEFMKVAPKFIKHAILFKGAATEKIMEIMPNKLLERTTIVETMKDAFKEAITNSKRGDLILLSPAAASFGIFKNEYDRGDQFIKMFNDLK